MKDMSAYRVHHGSPANRTIDFDIAPELGEDRERQIFRARFWRATLVGLAVFWGGIAWLASGAI